LKTNEPMRLDGIHHVTAITGDGQRCLDFYAGILGLAFAGRGPDFEAPGSHLIRFGCEPGRPDGLLRFIEAPGIRRGRAGDGMAHRLEWSVRFPAAVDYWAVRLSEAGIDVHRGQANGAGPILRFSDPEGLEHELAVDPRREAGLAMGAAAIAPEHALLALSGVRAYGKESVPSADILAGRLGFSALGDGRYLVMGERRRSRFAFDTPPATRGAAGAGTIHHVAWAADGHLPAWRQRVIGLGCRATPVIERGRCRSIYFREPSGVLFEIATWEAGVATAHGGDRDELRLSPRVDPRIRRPAQVG
jgi:glyoxalase family protein